MKSHTGFRLVSKLVTLNDLEQRNNQPPTPAVSVAAELVKRKKIKISVVRAFSGILSYSWTCRNNDSGNMVVIEVRMAYLTCQNSMSALHDFSQRDLYNNCKCQYLTSHR